MQKGTGRFSRQGRTSPFGKLDDRMETYPVESLVKVKVLELATELGLPMAEFQREVQRILAFGPEHMKKVHGERIAKIAEKLGIGVGT